MNSFSIFKNQRGAVFIEFVLVAGILLSILFGAVEFSLMFYNKQLLTNITGQVARDAINSCNDNNSGCNTALVKTLAERLCGINVPPGTDVPKLINLHLSQQDFLNIQQIAVGTYNAWEITISATYQPIVSALIGINSQIPITGKAVMIKERP